MSDRKYIADQILDHLELYRELGVRWAASSVPAKIAAAGSGKPSSVKAHHESIENKTSSAPRKEGAPEVVHDLDVIRTELHNCSRCKLSPGRKNIVFGSGNPKADLMFIGEAPGADEDEQGLPFVGRAGQLLTKIIESIDMRREDVFICNILKCRPPGNRNPEPDEIAACEQFLFRQIDSVRPKVICALGAFSAKTLLRSREPISRLRGHLVDFRGAKLMATFHPAYLLRSPAEKRKVWEDVQAIRDYLKSQ